MTIKIIHTMRELGLAFAILALVGCVLPKPLPGEPVPTISTTTEWSATAQTITVTATFEHISPNSAWLYAQGKNGDMLVQATSAPFTFTLDATLFPPGSQDFVMLASDDTTVVIEEEVMTISGCNNFHQLCDKSYAAVRYATTHNSMSNAENGWLGPNQAMNVPAQLNAGVRGLMLDTYSAGYVNFLGGIQVPDADPDLSFLCHAVCALGKQPLAEGLAEIRQFLDDNPGEVVTLIIESYLSHELTAAAFDAAALTQYAYVHSGGVWPTLGEMIDAGTRLVVFQDVAVNPLFPWQMNIWSHAFETGFSAESPEDFSCVRNRGSANNDLFIFNHFLTNIFGSPEFAEQVNVNPLQRSRIDECESFHGTTANFITVDFVSIGDTLENVNALNGLD